MKITRKQLKKLIKESASEEDDIRQMQIEKIKGLITQGQFNMAESLADSLEPPIDVLSIIVKNRKARDMFLKEMNVVDNNAVQNMLYKFADNTKPDFLNDMLKYIAADPKLSQGFGQNGVPGLLSIMNKESDEMYNMSGDAQMYLDMSYATAMDTMQQAVGELIGMLFIGRLLQVKETFKSYNREVGLSELVKMLKTQGQKK